MTNYVALLRGVNLVGKSTLKMADLKVIADGLGLEKAHTYIASGNLLFTSNKPEEKLRRMLEKELQAHMTAQSDDDKLELVSTDLNGEARRVHVPRLPLQARRGKKPKRRRRSRRRWRSP